MADYVADWGASAGPTVREAPPYAFRRQSEADLEAARWNLLVWEDPHHPQWAELFWADAVMVEARVTRSARHVWRQLVRRAGATYTGLRLLDGALVLKVSRGQRGRGSSGCSNGARVRPGGERSGGRSAPGPRCAHGWRRVESLEGGSSSVAERTQRRRCRARSVACAGGDAVCQGMDGRQGFAMSLAAALYFAAATGLSDGPIEVSCLVVAA